MKSTEKIKKVKAPVVNTVINDNIDEDGLNKKVKKQKPLKKYKTIKVENGITYLESDYDASKVKKFASVEKKKKLSEKRRAREIQPNSGNSSKCMNFFQQLHKDYIKQSSALGKFMRGISASMTSKDRYDRTDLLNIEEENMLPELVEDFDEYVENYVESDSDRELLKEVEELVATKEIDINLKKKKGRKKKVNPYEDLDEIDLINQKEFQKSVKITNKDKVEIKKWLDKNKEKLQSITAKNAILFEYSIQIILFQEFKLSQFFVTSIEENASNYVIVEDKFINSIDNETFVNDRNIKEIEDTSTYIKLLLQKKMYNLLYDENKEDLYDKYELKFDSSIIKIERYLLEKEINVKYYDAFIDIVVYLMLLKENKLDLSLINDYILSINSELSNLVKLKDIKNIV